MLKTLYSCLTPEDIAVCAVIIVNLIYNLSQQVYPITVGDIWTEFSFLYSSITAPSFNDLMCVIVDSIDIYEGTPIGQIYSRMLNDYDHKVLWCPIDGYESLVPMLRAVSSCKHDELRTLLDLAGS